MSQSSQGSVGQDQLDITHEQIQAAIAKVVWKNENLRSEFVKDPKAAIEKNLGIKFADGINVKCVDATDPKTVYYILPHHPSKSLGVEFTDEQLDAVAGGFSLGSLGGLLSLGGNAVGALAGLGGGLATAIGGKGSGTAASILGSISQMGNAVGGMGGQQP